MLNTKIMIVGYNNYDEPQTVVDFVDTVEEAIDKDNSYHHKYRYTDFLECLEEGGRHFYEEIEYKIGDTIYC